MKSKHIVLATALLGGLLSTTAFATTTAAHAQTTAALKFDAPAPVQVVSPVRLPRSAEGATVTLAMTIDAAGQPHDVRVVGRGHEDISRNLVAAVSQWKFSPARKNGAAVPAKVLLPLELVDRS